MCPLISPPRSAPSSLILASINECPVFHIIGTPPDFSISSVRLCEHLTSKTIFAPGFLVRISLAKIIINLSPQIISPSSSTTPILSPSPSYAIPRSAPSFLTAVIKSFKFSGMVGSGWWLGKFPSDWQ